MEKMIEILTNNGLTHDAAEIMANDINHCLGLMELTGSMKPEAVIGFYYAAKERGLDSNYVKSVITIAKKLYETNN